MLRLPSLIYSFNIMEIIGVSLGFRKKVYNLVLLSKRFNPKCEQRLLVDGNISQTNSFIHFVTSTVSSKRRRFFSIVNLFVVEFLEL